MIKTILTAFILGLAAQLLSAQFADPELLFQNAMSSPLFLTSADLDSDGYMDLVLSNSNGIPSIAWGEEEGYQIEYPIDLSYRYGSLKAHDWNGDGHIDLLGTTLNSQSLIIQLGDGQRGFSGQLLKPGANFHAMIDLENDGSMELLYRFDGMLFSANLNSELEFVNVLEKGEALIANKSIVVDFDGNGFMDYLTDASQLFLNTNGELEIHGIGESPFLQYVLYEDINGDGKMDRIRADSNIGFKWAAQGDNLPSFEPYEPLVDCASLIPTRGAVFADVVGDAQKDLVFVSNVTDSIYVSERIASDEFAAVKGIGVTAANTLYYEKVDLDNQAELLAQSIHSGYLAQIEVDESYNTALHYLVGPEPNKFWQAVAIDWDQDSYPELIASCYDYHHLLSFDNDGDGFGEVTQNNYFENGVLTNMLVLEHDNERFLYFSMKGELFRAKIMESGGLEQQQLVFSIGPQNGPYIPKLELGSADINGDGLVDLICAFDYYDSVQVFIANPDGSLQDHENFEAPRLSSRDSRFQLGSLMSNSSSDLLYLHFDSLAYLKHLGEEGFSDFTSISNPIDQHRVIQYHLADMDADGLDEIIAFFQHIADPSVQSLWQYDGAEEGSWTQLLSMNDWLRFTLLDVDEDADLDITALVANQLGVHRVRTMTNESGAFHESHNLTLSVVSPNSTNASNARLLVLDFDQDNDQDLLVYSLQTARIQLLENLHNEDSATALNPASAVPASPEDCLLQARGEVLFPSSKIAELAYVQLFDLQGRLVFESKIANESAVSLPKHVLPGAIYLYRLTSENGLCEGQILLGAY